MVCFYYVPMFLLNSLNLFMLDIIVHNQRDNIFSVVHFLSNPELVFLSPFLLLLLSSAGWILVYIPFVWICFQSIWPVLQTLYFSNNFSSIWLVGLLVYLWARVHSGNCPLIDNFHSTGLKYVCVTNFPPSILISKSRKWISSLLISQESFIFLVFVFKLKQKSIRLSLSPAHMTIRSLINLLYNSNCCSLSLYRAFSFHSAIYKLVTPVSAWRRSSHTKSSCVPNYIEDSLTESIFVHISVHWVFLWPILLLVWLPHDWC